MFRMTLTKMVPFLVSVLAFMVSVQCQCDEGWESYPFDRYCFQFNKEKKTWAAAKAACEAQSGYLAEPSDCATDLFLRLKVRHLGGDWWMGGTDEDTEGSFRWDYHDKKLTYKNWAKGEPNNSNGKQNCMQFWYNQQWDDVGCWRERPYVCQKYSM